MQMIFKVRMLTIIEWIKIHFYILFTSVPIYNTCVMLPWHALYYALDVLGVLVRLTQLVWHFLSSNLLVFPLSVVSCFDISFSEQ